MEHEGYIQKSDYQVAKEAKSKLYSIANNTHEGNLPDVGPGRLAQRAYEKKGRVEAIVNETPELK